jgi:hypothetical protein
VLVLVVFLVVAGVVSGLVTAATRRAIEAARARSDQTGQAFRSRVRNFDNYRLRILLAGGLTRDAAPSRDSEHDPAQSRRARKGD